MANARVLSASQAAAPAGPVAASLGSVPLRPGLQPTGSRSRRPQAPQIGTAAGLRRLREGTVGECGGEAAERVPVLQRLCLD